MFEALRYKVKVVHEKTLKSSENGATKRLVTPYSLPVRLKEN